MRSRGTLRWAWLFLLSPGLFLQAPLAAGQQRLLPKQPELSVSMRGQLAEAARDSTLEPWQSEFMLGMIQDCPDHSAAAPSQALPVAAVPCAGIAADDGAWIDVPPPPVRSGHTAVYDPVRDRMVVFDGVGLRGDVWTLSLAGSPSWIRLAPSGTPPAPRMEHAAVYDPLRDRMIVFGGRVITTFLGDLWALSLGESPSWSALAPTGSPPSPREGHTAIYDPVRDRMVVFGGYDGSSKNDTWALSLDENPAWTPLAPTGSPPSWREGHTAIYDPVRDRMVVFGGHDGSYTPSPHDPSPMNDTWGLSLAGSPNWGLLTPTGSPPSWRHGHSAIYDSAGDRMIVFGGYTQGGTYSKSTYELALGGAPAWSKLLPSGDGPEQRARHEAFYDLNRAGIPGGSIC